MIFENHLLLPIIGTTQPGGGFLLKLLVVGPPLLVAVILHEVAHGYVAEKLGDPTARKLGRITVNPLVHIDPVMTVLLPALLILSGSPVIFGGAKPVPVNPTYFANPRRAMVWVAMAGPATNFVLAALSYGLFWLILATGSGFVGKLLLLLALQSLMINLVLAVFNLIPIPPLDGGRIAVGLLPLPLARFVSRIEPFGILIVFLLLYSGILDKVLVPIFQAIEGQLF